MKRRKFIQTTTSATTALMLSSLKKFAKPQTIHNMKAGFQLKILATNWGYNGSLDEYLSKAKSDGYDGIENWWPQEKKDQDELFSALKKYNLEIGFLTGDQQSNYNEHFNFFKQQLYEAATNTIQKPLYINCHSGKDFFTMEQNENFIAYTTEIANKTGIKICHETHRSRMLFAAPVAKQYLQKHPELRLTFDVSHWCNVSESLLADQQETIDLALPRVDHIHARIGHAEGPQVNDPRAPEWKDAVAAHFAWWDKIVEMKKANGEVLTVLTEFGPPDYMPTEPYTRKPMSDQWEVNAYMKDLLRKRYC